MKTLYLHMGFHKTATTSFQATCEANAARLKSQGYVYPIFKVAGKTRSGNGSNHSIPMVSSFSERPEGYHANIRHQVDDIEKANRDYLAQLERYLSLDADVILSGEGMSNLNFAALTRLLAYLEGHGLRVVPIVCVRSPYAYHCSSAQTVVNIGKHVDFSRFRSQKRRVQKIRKMFGDKVRFIAFGTACAHLAGPVPYLLEACGVDATGFEIIRQNERRSAEFVRLQNALNKLQPVIIDGKKNPDFFRVEKIEGSRFLLDEEEFSSIQEALQEENRFFGETLGPEFCDTSFERAERFDVEHLVASYPQLFFPDSMRGNRWQEIGRFLKRRLLRRE